LQGDRVPVSRTIAWEGFFNARDLGGLPLTDGGTTGFGTFVRSADLRFVTEHGWQEAGRAGMRTIIDLRNDHEVDPGTAAPPGMDRLNVPLDDIEDTEFWGEILRDRIDGTPLYMRPFLERKTERCAVVISAIAAAPPGGVLYHCAAGRDRTGIVTLLLLALAGVEPDAIAADYELSIEALRPLFAAMGREDEGPTLAALLRERGTTVREAVLATLDGFDAEDVLLAAGASVRDIETVRGRLVRAASSPPARRRAPRAGRWPG
jgi:protein-tyrosine phosphatase